MAHERIEMNPDIMGGKPVIRGTRVPVETVLRKLGAGMTADAILADHPRLTRDDILAAQAFAADCEVKQLCRKSVDEDEVDGEVEKAVEVRRICEITRVWADSLWDEDSAIDDEMLQADRQRYARFKRKALELAESITDEFSYHAALDSIIRLCMKAKETDEAAALLEKITTDVIRRAIVEEFPKLAVV